MSPFLLFDKNMESFLPCKNDILTYFCHPTIFYEELNIISIHKAKSSKIVFEKSKFVSKSMAYNVFREQRAEKEKKGFVSIYFYEKIFILPYSFFI